VKSARRIRPIYLPVLAITALLLFKVWGWFRGPELPAYRIESRPLVQMVVATGRVISTSRAAVGSEITATVLERRVKEGDVVAAGDVLAVLRADDLAARVREAEAALRQLQQAGRPQALAALQQAEVQLAQATRERQRRADLHARQLIARVALEQAEESEAVARTVVERARLAASATSVGRSEELQLRERLAAARAQLAKTVLRATVAGTVLTRNAEPGDLVQPGRVLFEIARGGDTEIEVPVDEKNLSLLALGQRAQCFADAYPDDAFVATLNFLAPRIDAQRGTVDIRLKVDPVPGFLRQDMTVSVNVETGRKDQALVVPNDALLNPSAGAATAIVVRNGRVQRLPVKLGLKSLALTEVTSGIDAGDTVLAAAASVADIAGGKRVRVTDVKLPDASNLNSSRREMPVQLN
jgi:HlyD family secretion protein